MTDDDYFAIEFARQYYRWFWGGSSIGVIAFGDQRRHLRDHPAPVRARYRTAMRDVYLKLDLSNAAWDDDTGKTVCEVCLRFRVPTLLVKIAGRGLISRDDPGDLVCAKCHPEAEARIRMVQLGDMVGV